MGKIAVRQHVLSAFQQGAPGDAAKRRAEAGLPQGVRVGGKVYTVLEGGIYVQTQEGPYNFVNVIHDHALHFFGEAYLDREERKSFKARNVPIYLQPQFQ